MNNNHRSQFDFSKPVYRDQFIDLLNAAYIVKSYRFCRQAALVWLITYPGDLLFNLFLAKSFSGDGKPSQAVPILEKICLLDPEFTEALIELSFLKSASQKGQDPQTIDLAVGNSSKNSQPHDESTWHIVSSRKALLAGDFEAAESFAHKALAANPDSPLPALQHMRLAFSKDNQLTIQNLALVYHERWPDCLQFSLFLADSQIKNGNESAGVALLNQCVAKDNAAQVAIKIWGKEFPYKPLWPADMSIKFDMAIPANVAAYMGWNQLNAGEMDSAATEKPLEPQKDDLLDQQPQTTDEIQGNNEWFETPSLTLSNNDQPINPQSAPQQTENIQSETKQDEFLAQIQLEFEHIAKQLKKPGYVRADGRFPIYVIFSSQCGLENQYGPQTTSVLIDHMKEVVSEVVRHKGWGATIFMPDSPEFTTSFNLKPISTIDPWKLKLSLADLDRALAKQGSMIGALLIVGGPKVVPFHQLPNPTIDNDAEVPSDNPYATLDENYFIPEWPVGRLPGDASSDAGLLITQLRKVISYHTDQNNQQKRGIAKVFNKVAQSFRSIFSGKQKTRYSCGLTAEVWQPSSSAVFRPIGKANSLLSSPPVTAGHLNKKIFPSYLGYFNLHGIQDAVEWYGQKRADRSTKWPEYPVALSPSDMDKDKIPKIVFSEACYGTYIEGKAINQAMSLNFLSKGSLAVIGSTVTSYGSVTDPLIAADLLGYYFWHFIRQGYMVGNALLKAKLSLVREMSKRQGFLDGEDQKTLLSFVLLGDPLTTIQGSKTISKNIIRSKKRPSVNTSSDQPEGNPTSESIPAEALAQVKEIVARYLPELQESNLTINHQQYAINFVDPQETNGKSKKAVQIETNRVVITLSKQIQSANKVHSHYARFTLDPQGKVLKCSASR